jgi:ligand-binding sensor domain-containing protein/two-component sensor histidine kinase
MNRRASPHPHSTSGTGTGRLLLCVAIKTLLALAPILKATESEALPAITLQDLGYRFKHWSVDEGLPSGFVFSVAQTSDGYLWASTLDGVARCDGRRFTAFRNPDLDDRLFYRPDLHVDNQGQLWVISRHGGMVVRYQDGKFLRLGPEDGIHKGGSTLARGSGADSPFLKPQAPTAESSNLLSRRDNTSFQVRIQRTPIQTNAVFEDPSDGTLWLFSQEGDLASALYRVTPDGTEQTTLTTPEGASPGALRDLLLNPDGQLILLAEAGTFLYKDGNWKLHRKFQPAQTLPPRRTRGCYDWQGNLWILAENQIRIARPDGTVRTLSSTPFEESMNLLFCDREGSIWIPTQRGLYQFVPSAFTNWPMEKGSTRSKVLMASQDGEGRMWFAGERNFYSLAPGDAAIQPIPGTPLGGHIVIGAVGEGAYLVDRNGKLGFATPQAITALGDAPGFLRQTRDGTLWGPAPGGLLRRTSPRSEPEIVPIVPPGNAFNAEHMEEDSKGIRFVAVRGIGLVQLDGVPEPRVLSGPSDDPVSKRPSSLHVDPDDNIWLISRGPNGLGLWQQANEQWHFAEWQALNLPFPAPTGISVIGDRSGGFWVVSTSGLLRCDRAELIASLEKGGQPIPWRQFDRSDGLATIACSSMPNSSHLDDRGRLWIPTDAGVAMTDPVNWTDFREQIPSPPVLLDSVFIDNKQVSLDGASPVTLQPENQLLELKAQALHFANPDRVNYRYRLIGFQDTWTPAGKQNSIRYQHLPPGNYQFQITADNGYGSWNENPATLDLIITPKWWQRSWVPWFGLLMLIAIGALIYKVRISKISKRQALQEAFSRELLVTQEAERKRIAHELHDSLGQELLVIKSRLDLGNFDAPVLAESVKDAIQQVKQISRELRPALLERIGLASALEAMIHQVSDATGLPIEHEIGEIDGLLSSDAEISIYRFVQEAFNNIVAHSDASEARLSLRPASDKLILQIEDDGRGFEPAKVIKSKTAGLGYRGMSERAALLGGSFDCVSSPGNGTIIRAEFPYQKVS